MRLAASTLLFLYGVGTLLSTVPPVSTDSGASGGFGFFSMATALLVLVGLWTPVAGVLTAIASAWHAVAIGSNLSSDMLLGVLGLALALLGPGAFSVDSRLFGWKRLEIQDGASADGEPGNGSDRKAVGPKRGPWRHR